MTEPDEKPRHNRTALYPLYRELGAKIVPFAGYEMPLNFEGVVKEHINTRSSAGLFDVSHMGIVDVIPKDNISIDNVIDAAETITPSGIRELQVGSMRYALLTNDLGCVVDDCIVTRRSNHLQFVINASRVQIDLGYLDSALSKYAQIEHRTDLAQLAIQGPKSETILSRFGGDLPKLAFMEAMPFQIDNIECEVSRSGYTGEDGFEVIVRAENALQLAKLLLSNQDLYPCGLGARDSLRLEAGLCLYGHELNETTTPIEARLAWTIPKRRRDDMRFAGAETILSQRSNGASKLRVGIISLSKRPIREDAVLRTANGDEIGHITSGGFGPSCGHPVAMGYASAAYLDDQQPLIAHARGKEFPCRVATIPFTPHNYKRT